MSWEDCRDALHRVALVLPTEAQWERAARAATHTPWSCARNPESLESAANLADHAYERGFKSPTVSEDWDDGFAVHAPVGSFAANAFGLHDVHGNVWEWCRDWYVPHGGGLRPDDDAHPEQPTRVYRGGCFSLPAVYARSALRFRLSPFFNNLGLGCRPSKSLAAE